MKTTLIAILLSFSAQAFSGVVKSYDEKNDCTLYRVQNVSAETELAEGEEIVFKRDSYGLEFKDLEINFETREAAVRLDVQVVLGFNRPLLEEKITFSPDRNEDFSGLLNLVNRKVNAIGKVCLQGNQLVYLKLANSEE